MGEISQIQALLRKKDLKNRWDQRLQGLLGGKFAIFRLFWAFLRVFIYENKRFLGVKSVKISNKTGKNMSIIEGMINNYYPYAQEYLKFDKPVNVSLLSDPKNAQDSFGKTAYYDPNNREIAIYTDNRHPKDMLRSFSHELVHHAQNCRGDLEGNRSYEGQDYYLHDSYMKKLEEEAYLVGNGKMFREYEENLKKQRRKSEMNEEKLRKVIRMLLERTMGENEVKENDINEEAADNLEEQESVEENEELEEQNKEELEEGDDSDYGKRSVKAGRDNNPKVTAADRGLGESDDKKLEEGLEKKQTLKENKQNNLYDRLMSKWCK